MWSVTYYQRWLCCYNKNGIYIDVIKKEKNYDMTNLVIDA